ncbi:dTDP-4-amino-4,6-dideoxygalactose transaminase [Methylobacterium sp. J-068]|nr:dTDP-4-amino-4,6-dideoxygalactose transaminase [Methylobacterium sp. J-068]
MSRALAAGALQGGGAFTERCHAQLREAVPGSRPFLTTSCTDALEMATLIIGLNPGDEVVMPSWTFSSTANAVALRGAVPVFVDIREDTLNIDPVQAAAAVTPRTRALVCVHYAGVGCDMDTLVGLCRDRNITLIEDAAQAFGATWNGAPLGGFGDFGAFSFHASKNVSCGEGGALHVNRADLVQRADLVWHKGTDRSRFDRGEVQRYEWCALGSSFTPSEATAALLSAQLAEAAAINRARRCAWAYYAELLEGAGSTAHLRLPHIPVEAGHNGHIFAIRTLDQDACERTLEAFRSHGIDARTHYRPLHSSPAGRHYGRSRGRLPVTDAVTGTLIRLPLDAAITRTEQEYVVEILLGASRSADRRARASAQGSSRA